MGRLCWEKRFREQRSLSGPKLHGPWEARRTESVALYISERVLGVQVLAVKVARRQTRLSRAQMRKGGSKLGQPAGTVVWLKACIGKRMRSCSGASPCGQCHPARSAPCTGHLSCLRYPYPQGRGASVGVGRLSSAASALARDPVGRAVSQPRVTAGSQLSCPQPAYAVT